MTAAYWDQWSHEEIREMHGIDFHYEEDDDLYMIDPEPEESESCGCKNCMECLGMTWADFM